MKIESIRLRNFKIFRDVYLEKIPSFLVVIGANGTGKSTLFDVFGFLHDCLNTNVRQALDKRGRFPEVLSRGCDPQQDSIVIELQYRMEITGKDRLVTYSLEIGQHKGSAIIKREVLRYKRGAHGSPYHFLDFTEGKGFAIINEEDFTKPDEKLTRENQEVASDTLAIKGLGQFERFKAANAFRRLIENWHISDFHISAARGRKEAVGEAEHLVESGENLPLVARYLHEQHPKVFEEIIHTMTRCVPGVSSVEPKLMDDGYLTLRFKDGSFKTPFLDRYVSDGTIKMFAYLVLLHDPEPHPLLCVEEPESQLYPQLISELVEEFRNYANKSSRDKVKNHDKTESSTGSSRQVFVSTHSPVLVNALALEEVYWLVKHEGYTSIRRAKDDPQVAAYMADGDHLGSLWSQGFFTGVDPQ